MKIRRANADEAGILSDLSFRSKAFWGYSHEFIEACRGDLTVSPEYASSSLVFVVEDGGTIKGFFALERERDRGLLSFFFVEPDSIGQGYGRALWKHMIQVAGESSIRTVAIHSDPNAEGFYLSMGAKRMGEVESTVFPGRKLPLMEAEITERWQERHERG